jgi:prepilin-type N-terminal cleavage/methylation domain-containing protein
MRKDAMKRKMGKKSPAGLTLMELIIVLAVLAILVGIASPLIAQFSSGFKLRGAAREVATDLQFARLLAVKENKNSRVVFSANSYEVRVGPIGSETVTKSRSFGVDYPQITLSGSAVAFNSRGIVTSGSGTITVSHPMGTKNITVSSTGRVQVQ